MKQLVERYLILYVPWVIAVILKSEPTVSYLIAWLGSFFIFYMTLGGKLKPLPNDRSIAEQLMRPVFLVQIIFAGYMCCTSIFYFLDLMGYENFQKVSDTFLVDYDKLLLTADCQRYYCLGHAAFATGILIFMDYSFEPKYYVNKDVIANLLLKAALISLPISILTLEVNGLAQFSNQFSSLSFISGTLALAFAIPLKNIRNTLVCLVLYFFNFSEALVSGFKEPIIISVLVLGVFLYPSYKKIVLMTFVPALLLLFFLLPTFNTVFRQNAWSGNTDAGEATQLALDAALNSNNSDDTGDTNWSFLTLRLSEIDMFTEFVSSTPSSVDFYGLTLLKQSAIVLVPRIFWAGKPSTEDLVMQRVFDAGVVNRNSSVSAKPAYIVDGYLSGGTLGVFLALFIYGAAAQLISIKAEKLFGGYVLGTALIFSGLFQIFWRGLSFEFIINSVFWSYMSMLVIFRVMRMTNIIQEV
jgi:hypothetical protein